MENIRKKICGILLCLVIAVPCWFLGKRFEVVGGPVFAIIAGMVITCVIKGDTKEKLQDGITFTAKKILQYAVILLGFGLNLGTIAQVGGQSLPIIVATITTSLVIAFVLCKLMKIPSKISVLVGVGSSICGGSAIAATAPVIEAEDEEVAQAISVIFLFNVIAALIFPTMGKIIGLSNEGFAIFAGTAVNDTSSVTAAASAWEGMTGATDVLDGATVVKLTRTLAIIPISLALAFIRTRNEKQNGTSVSLKSIFPFFILYFIAASVITTVATVVFGVDKHSFDIFKTLSKFFIVMSMSAIGLNTNIVKLVKTGGKPIFMGFCCWVGIACVSLVMQSALNIW
jgi:uncharacterized integral membrane protein (TIGR00698 family)